MRLVEGQLVADGRIVPTREALIWGAPGVMVVSTQHQTEQLIKRYADTKSTIPLALVAPKDYTMDDTCKARLPVKPQQCNLQFALCEQGGKEVEAHCRCVLYQLTKGTVLATEVGEINMGSSVAVTYKIEFAQALLKGRGYWIPYEADVVEGRRFLREIIAAEWEHIRDLWQPKALGRGRFLIKTSLQQAPGLHAALVRAGVCVYPPQEVMDATKVV
eukprot:4755205-Amphidinium_carterae.1